MNFSDAGFPDEGSVQREEMASWLKAFAKVVSFLFHPLLIPLYITWFLAYVHPVAFAGFSSSGKRQVIMIIALNVVFFPLFSVFLLRGIGFIRSVYLRTRKDRIIPYIASGIFFFWAYTVFKQQPQYPFILRSFLLGIFLSVSAALIANIYFKISMHAIGMGGWLGLFIVIFMENSMLMTWPLAIVIILSGLVGTARLILSEHEPVDIYAGWMLGLSAQFIASAFT